MKLVAVSRVKNEIDIIEAFVRHTLAHFDKLIVLDDGSSDGTYEAMLALQASGLPLVVLREPSVGYEQSRYMTRLLHMAVHQFGADWVAPLDADEFVEPPAGMTLAQVLEGRAPTPLTMAWNGFVWRPRDDENPQINPVLRLRMRLPPHPRQSLGKVLVPAALVSARAIELRQGNHALVVDGVELPSQPLESVNLCHFPIRGVAQFTSKIAVGYLQYAATPDWDRAIGWHYLEPFRLLGGGVNALTQTMEASSRRYSIEDFEPGCGEAVHAPLRYAGGGLTLTGGRQDPLANVLQCAESIALERAEYFAAHAALTSALAGATPGSDAPPLERLAALQLGARDGELALREWRRASEKHWILRLQFSRLQADLAALTDQHGQLGGEHGQLVGDHHKLLDDHRALQADHRIRLSDHEKLTAAHSDLKDRKAAVERRLGGLEDELAGLRDELAHLRNALADLNAVARSQTEQLSSRAVHLARRLHRLLVRTGLPTTAIADRCARLWRLAKLS